MPVPVAASVPEAVPASVPDVDPASWPVVGPASGSSITWQRPAASQLGRPENVSQPWPGQHWIGVLAHPLVVSSQWMQNAGAPVLATHSALVVHGVQPPACAVAGSPVAKARAAKSASEARRAGMTANVT